MKLVTPLYLISWRKTPNDAVTPQLQSQLSPKMKAKAIPRLVSSLVWIDQYNECNRMRSLMEFMGCCQCFVYHEFIKLFAHLEMLSLSAVAFCKIIKFWIEDVGLKTARLRNIWLNEDLIEHCVTYVIGRPEIQGLIWKHIGGGANSFYKKNYQYYLWSIFF